MNGPAPKNHLMKRMNRLILLPVLALILALARMASAADAVYQNDAIINYPVTVDFPPVIDATNFVNTGSFTVNFTTFSLNPYYETSDTSYYTNSGLMQANTGFYFDTSSSSTGLRTMAGNFVNPGTVDCGGLFFASATNIMSPGTVDVGINGLMQFTGQSVDLSYGTLQSKVPVPMRLVPEFLV